VGEGDWHPTMTLHSVIPSRLCLEFMFTVDCDGLLLLKFMPQKALKTMDGTTKQKHRNADMRSSYP